MKRIGGQSEQDYAWIRSREFRHRQAHYYDMGYDWDTAQSVCRREILSFRTLTKFKEYPEEPNNACSGCLNWIRKELMREIAK